MILRALLRALPWSLRQGVSLASPEGVALSTSLPPSRSRGSAPEASGRPLHDSRPEGQRDEAKGALSNVGEPRLLERPKSPLVLRWRVNPSSSVRLEQARGAVIWVDSPKRRIRKNQPRSVDPKVYGSRLRRESTHSGRLTRILDPPGMTTSRLLEERGGETQHLLLYFASINLHSPVRHGLRAFSPEGVVATPPARAPEGVMSDRTLPPTPRTTEVAFGAALACEPLLLGAPRASSRCGDLDGFAKAAYRKRNP
jgi:hypothetical protein